MKFIVPKEKRSDLPNSLKMGEHKIKKLPLYRNNKIIGAVYTIVLATTLFLLFACQKKDGFSDALTSHIQWSQIEIVHPLESDVRFNYVVWDGSHFILACDYGLLMKSVNGVQWESIEPILDGGIGELAYGNGVYLTKSHSTVYRSTDLNCWQKADFDQSNLSNLLWTGKQFIIASKKALFSSVDGVQWKPTPHQLPCDIKKLSWDGSGFVAQCDKGHWFSKDGIKWDSFLQGSNIVEPILWKGKLYGTSATNPWLFVKIKDDWQMVLKPKSDGLFGITNGFSATEKFLLAFGDHLSWSSDGTSWGSVPLPKVSRGWLKQVVHGNGRYVAIGDSGLMMVGTDQNKLAKLQQDIAQNKALLENQKENKKKLSKDATLKEQIDHLNFPKGFYQEKKDAESKTDAKAVRKKPEHSDAIKPVETLSANEAIPQILNLLGIKGKDHKTATSKIQKEYPDYGKMDLIISVLSEMGTLLWFDVEAGTYPVPYDWLVAEFSKLASQQNIRVDQVSMELKKLSCNEREQYQVRWRLNGTVYGIDFFDDSDWYSGLVFDAFNTSLFLNGYRQRLVGLDSGDQTAQFLLIDPDDVVALGLY